MSKLLQGCPDGCNPVDDLPQVGNSPCPRQVKYVLGGLAKILFAIDGTEMDFPWTGCEEDVTPMTTWLQANVDNTSVGGVRELRIKGTKGEPTPETLDAEGGYCESVICLTHTIDFSNLDLTKANHELLRQIQCLKGEVTFWYVDHSCRIYGGQNGIKGSFTKAVHVISAGNKTPQQHDFTLKWDDEQDPECTIYPFDPKVVLSATQADLCIRGKVEAKAPVKQAA